MLSRPFLLPGQLPVIGNCAEHFRKQANYANPHSAVFYRLSGEFKTQIPIYFDSTRSEIDFLDNLPIEERNQPLLDTKCIFQVCLDDEHVIRPGFHHIDDFTEAIAFRRNYRQPIRSFQ